MTKSAISCGVLERTSESANPSLMPSENRITVSPSASGTERVVGCGCSAPLNPALGTIEIREAEHHAAQSIQRVVAPAHEIDERLASVTVERAYGGVRGGRGVLTVA